MPTDSECRHVTRLRSQRTPQLRWMKIGRKADPLTVGELGPEHRNNAPCNMLPSTSWGDTAVGFDNQHDQAGNAKGATETIRRFATAVVNIQNSTLPSAIQERHSCLDRNLD